MIIKRAQLVKEIQEIWPDLKDDLPNPTNIAIPRGEYWAPSVSDIEKFLKLDWTDQVKYMLESFACANFAHNLHAQSKIYVYVLLEQNKFNKENMREWAFGHCWGSRFNGRDTSHAINIARTSDEGIILIEPQNDKWWKAVAGRDVIHFLEM